MENNQNQSTQPSALAISIIALVCGILGLICSGSLLVHFYSFAFSVTAIVLGAIGKKNAKRSGENGAKGMAIAGLVLGIIGVADTIFTWIFIFGIIGLIWF